MPLVATVLAGSAESSLIRAVDSVLPWVDLLLVLDSGLAANHLATIQSHGGQKLRHVPFTWPQDFAAARNFALDQAAQLGGSWAVTIDTDEELHFPGYRSRAELLAMLNADTIFAHDGNQIALEFEDSTGNVAGEDLTHIYSWGPVVDQLLADESAGEGPLWALSDHLGTPRDLVAYDALAEETELRTPDKTLFL